MSAERDETRIVRSWLEEGVTVLPDRVLDAVLDRLPATPQRRAGWLARRFPFMNTTAKLALAAAAVAVAAFVGIRAVADNAGDPEATATPTVASSPTPFRAEQNLAPGTYTLDYFPVDVTFTVPEGWFAGRSAAEYAILLPAPGQDGGALAFWIVDNVFEDPCGGTAGELDPPVGPSVDDLVTAFSNMPGFEATAPVDVTVSGFSGKQIDLTRLDSGPSCEQAAAWTAGSYRTDMGVGEMRRLQILDVDGVRLMVTPVESAEADAGMRAEFNQILDSIRIGPPS